MDSIHPTLLNVVQVSSLDTELRHYRREGDWREIYAQIMSEDGYVSAGSLLARGLTKTIESAWKQISRHRKAGLIRRYAWPGLHETMSGSTVCRLSLNDDLARKRSIVAEMSTEMVDSMPSVQFKEHSVCNAKPNTSTLRSRRFRKRQKRKGCRCRAIGCCVLCVGDSILSALECERLDSLSLPRLRHYLYGELGRRVGPSGQFYGVMDKITSIQSRVHKVYFEYLDAQPDDRELSAYGTGRNRAIRQDIVVNGVHVHVERYRYGKVVLKPALSKTPLAPEHLPEFMTALQKALGTSVPTDQWRISATDLNRDIPIGSLQAFKRQLFDYKGITIQAYVKNINGERYLRVEAQIYPGTTLAGYYDVLAKADKILMEACGK